MHFALGGKRHLLAVLKKSEMCSCGCKHWDSLFPVWTFLAWGFEHLLKGEHPGARHDLTPFRDSEPQRRDRAGNAIGFKALCMFIKSDISEYSSSFGLPGLADAIVSCPFCYETSDTSAFYSTMGLSPLGSGFASKRAECYNTSSSLCETFVTLDAANQKAITRLLAFDKSRGGGGGRALVADLPELGLAKGMRLEPTIGGVVDVASFEAAPLGTRVCFWDRTKETLCRHRHPLFRAGTGCSITILGVDWMHTACLGVVQYMVHAVLWAIVFANPFLVPGTTASVITELVFSRMKDALFSFYDDELTHGRVYTRVQQFQTSFLAPKLDSDASYMPQRRWALRIFC